MYKYTLTEIQIKAENLLKTIQPPHAILLNGDLGSGKTTFAQYFLQPILVDKDQSIISPTFTIINVYTTVIGTVWHADLYRLKSEAELFELGLIEFANTGITLIEWPERILPYIKNIPTTIINF